MKKRSLWKRVAVAALSAVMLVGAASAVSAAPALEETQPVSLTIKKLQSDGTADDPEDNTPIEGVTFSYAKIGEFAQVTVEEGQDPAVHREIMGYTLEKEFLDTITITAIGTNVDGTKVYDGVEIQDALKTAVEGGWDYDAELLTDMPKTDANGKSKVEGLEQGLYLVVETDAPAEITKFSDPFIVSLPILDAEQDVWVYDVVAMPKNDYETIDGKKTITGIDDVELDEAGQEAVAKIGSKVTFNIASEVPTGDGTLEQFVVTDTMSQGLAFEDGSLKVLGYAIEDGTPAEELTEIPADVYTVAPKGDAAQGTVLTITFAVSKLHNKYAGIEITYDAVITKDAITIDAINNTASLDYDNDPETDSEFGTVTIEVYGYQFTKTDEKDAGLAGAEFKLYKDKECKTEVQMYDAMTDGELGNEIASVTSDADGKVYFCVAEAGTYYLKEVNAPNGYTALTKPVEITITEDSIQTSQMNIVNTKGFNLPATGGVGTMIFTAGGIVIMLGAVVLLVRANKANKK